MISKNDPAAMDQFIDSLTPLQIYPLWRQKGLLVRKPETKAVPYLWPYAPIRERLMEAGRLISAEEAERRVLILKNPGLEGKPAATSRLYAGMQLVLPHEIAPRTTTRPAPYALWSRGKARIRLSMARKSSWNRGIWF